MIKLLPFGNNIYVLSLNTDFENLYEKAYLTNIIEQIKDCNPLFFKEMDVLIYSSNRSNPPLDSLDINTRKTILIYLSDDWHLDKEFGLCDQFVAVFKCYTPRNYKNVFGFPLGYTIGFEGVEALSFSQKDISVFFTGQLNERRKDFVRQATQPLIAKLPKRVSNRFLPLRNVLDLSQEIENSKIEFNTQGWGKGLSKPEYIDHLRRTKIALCLGGYHVEETFRHYEALKMGAVVVSKKIENPVLKDAPFVYVEDWFGIFSRLKELLKNQDYLEEMSDKSLKFWEEKLSEKAIAKFILEKTEKFI